MAAPRKHTATRILAKAGPALIVLVALAGGACATGRAVSRPFPGAAPTGGATTLVATALEFRGVRYVNGGSTPSGFDCSGFV